MSIIQINNLAFTYENSYTPVFENVSFQIDTDWKLGFIGRNGKGKTTFLKLLTGVLEYSGTIASSVSFEYFPFEVTNPDLYTYEILEAVNPAMEQWELIRELSLLDTDADILYRPFGSLSFGERTKALLATLFLKDHAFLLIDEPTNHLDAHARRKTAEYLSQKKGFILVSHDRDFLDCCIDHILVLNRQTLEVRKGNFLSWYADKTARDAMEVKQNEHLKKEIGKLEHAAEQASHWSDQIERTKTGTRIAGLRPDRGHIGHQAAKMMKRAKSLENRKENAVVQKQKLLKDIESPQSLKLCQLSHHSKCLAAFRDVALDIEKGSERKNIFSHFNMDIMAGDRIALTGKNGCGKTSVIKLLLDALSHSDAASSPEAFIRTDGFICTGEITCPGGLLVSYAAQDTSFLKGTPARFAEENGLPLSLFYSVLHKLGLERTQFDKLLTEYSEGQKKKVLLAGSLCKPAHLFVWDEPLNFIDIFSRIQLEELLLEYQPTMLFVEHDRAFCKRIATKTILLENAPAKP